ncbi:MAG TPA: cation diffusion facilitator family transporter [Xanthomonadales bacterium]|nr:cation diffusion facilitator family transporter [Xanthomonadales bacterium]
MVSTQKSVYAALIGNLLVAATKTVAAVWTGSASMTSEAVHSFVDSGNEVLLLYGMRRSARPADHRHPLGYGRELYFWSFIVALLIFALGAALSVFEGVRHLREPVAIANPLVSYVVLGLAFVFEGFSFAVALKQFRGAKGELGYMEAVRRSKDPPSFMVLLEDAAAMLGILIALAATWLADTFEAPVFDAIGSIAIGGVLAAVALVLARESKSLLIGERADRTLTDALLELAAAEPGVAHANGVMTVQMAPNQVVAALSVEFERDLPASRIEAIVAGLEERIGERHPEVVTLFVKPQSRGDYGAGSWWSGPG